MRHTVTTGRADRILTAVVRLARPFDSSAHVGATRAVVRKILHSRPYGPPSFRIFSHALRMTGVARFKPTNPGTFLASWRTRGEKDRKEDRPPPDSRHLVVLPP